MPSINRIRVNNVKYNFGTQQYDDFTMRMYGKNTLYDLANGGGKSVLMLLLLQNLIPNCTLDEKQPIEKLFRNGGGNTTIHSLIEWKLDQPEQQDGYRYMTTGFCARKAKDSPDDEEGGKEMAAIEYFNYCIFYREFNDNDIINLPLVKNGERVSYSGWKNYLKELGKRDLSLEVRIFERKGEYQRFISRYGLHESHWEIVRGINKTEGHVRTYFETNYKTARKVVEDLLIEEIIEKAYQVKVEEKDSSDGMAHTLLDIKDKLVELARKKREISDYDRQTELLHVLEARVAAFLDIYEIQEKEAENIADICVTGATLAKSREDGMKELERKREERSRLLNRQRHLQECLKIRQNQLKLEALHQELGGIQEEIRAAETAVHACRQELAQKESMNDYLDYWRDKTLKEENEAVIEAALHQTEDQLSELRVLAAVRKERDDSALKELRASLRQEEDTLAKLEESIASLEVLEQETQIALALAAHDGQLAEKRYQADIQKMQELHTELEEIRLMDPKEWLKEQEENQNERKENMAALEAAIQKGQQDYDLLRQEVEPLKLEVEKKEKQLEELETNYRTYREQTGILRRMLEIYGEKEAEKTVEWVTNQDMDRLLHQIHQRYVANLAAVFSKKEDIETIKKRLQQLEEGRLLAPTEAAEKAKYYIESRHGKEVLFGVDYLAAQSEERRKELLSAHPLLPYGLLVEDFQALDTDGRFRELNLGDGFLPVYNLSMLGQTRTEEETGCVMYLNRGMNAFCSNTALWQEKEKRKEELEELTAEVMRLEEMNATYLEDRDFVAGLQGMAIVDVEQEQRRQKEELQVLRQELTDKETGLEQLKQERKEYQRKWRQIQQEFCHFLEERGTIEAIEALSRQMEEAEQEQRNGKAEQKRLQALLDQYQSDLFRQRSAESESRHRLENLQKQAKERLSDWEQYFKAYYIEETQSGALSQESRQQMEQAAGWSDEVIASRFKALKTVVEKNTITLEDKKKLIAALQTAMDKAMKSISGRNGDLEELESLRQSHRLYKAEEKDLSLLSTEISRLSLTEDTLRSELAGKQQQADRLEGSIEQAIQTLEERFGSYEEPQGTAERIAADLKESASVLEQMKQENQKLEQEYQQYSKEYSAMLDLHKDVKRIVEGNAISLQNAKVLMIGKEQLRDQFEGSLLRYDKSKKSLERAKNELHRYKLQTAQALIELQALDLAETVSRDIELPGNLGEARQLINSLSSIIDVIALEKERVVQGLEDMQIIKSNFESQCIQRCQDVKNELEKLPKLSRIILDGEAIQMVGLTIPYVKEEFLSQRMSEYIDDVVKGADKLTNNQERIKYIRGRLELKKLFSVIVTDMNAIRLTLYKRERIKEQSRYLRYEEAVGSTGQSQGIYIQFLVSIINYICGLYSPAGESQGIWKTIFIDNPFGAAKDIYIWEPIFALLKANQVQLIVPARGATPAITARFDVNYILGQQMVGKRQQTVVMDYRSQVEQEELEYRNLEYEQVSFDFI